MNVWKNQWLACLAAVCLVAAMTQISVAQGPGGPGGRGGRGPGGPGGGFGMNAGMLLGNEQVQGALDLTEDQKEEIKTIQQETRSAMGELFQRGGDDEDREARREKMTKMMSETAEKLAGILTDAQKTKLVGIMLKTDLAGALNDSLVKAELGISDEQLEKIATARQEAGAEMRELFAELRDASQEERREKMAEFRTAMEEKVNGVLTAEQKAKIEKLIAIDFELDRSQMRGPGGPGGPGGRGQGGPQGQRGQRGQRGNNNDNNTESDDDAI
ncbi:hypothetical protein LOC68_13005 [Blastopirellula sp. JC732]|uniref:Periplasmic heavy metal sensor n=1 Tax=Blastopirellula sediminis TaxID=2894196 RepID=A0A9X1MM27_9BACT|nr:hypothetical protein [Blastopirellula sediminis]MCC9607391.1 hypothetical protein [Blastopirellula sediminis]MCC9629316.1 hypothetical protein [Blastopirellula sediminis]